MISSAPYDWGNPNYSYGGTQILYIYIYILCLLFVHVPTRACENEVRRLVYPLVRIFARRVCRWCSTLEGGLTQDISSSTWQTLLGWSASRMTTACEWCSQEYDTWVCHSLSLRLMAVADTPHAVVSLPRKCPPKSP